MTIESVALPEEVDRGASLYRINVLQHVEEHRQFLDILKSEGVRSYLEIGSMYGGSLWRVAHALPNGSRLVSVDVMFDTPGAQPSLMACIRELRMQGYDAEVVIGDSMDADTIEAVRKLGPFDCVFIDGAHTLESVTSDWENYGPMGRLIAFHDIAWNDTWKSSVPGRVSKPMGVPTLWNELKGKYRHKEIKLHQPSNYYGIGVLWRD